MRSHRRGGASTISGDGGGQGIDAFSRYTIRAATLTRVIRRSICYSGSSIDGSLAEENSGFLPVDSATLFFLSTDPERTKNTRWLLEITTNRCKTSALFKVSICSRQRIETNFDSSLSTRRYFDSRSSPGKFLHSERTLRFQIKRKLFNFSPEGNAGKLYPLAFTAGKGDRGSS